MAVAELIQFFEYNLPVTFSIAKAIKLRTQTISRATCASGCARYIFNIDNQTGTLPLLQLREVDCIIKGVPL